MDSNLPADIRDLLRQRTGSATPSRYKITCFTGMPHTRPRELPYSYRMVDWGQENFSSEYWSANIDGIFINYVTGLGIVIDTWVYETEEARAMQIKTIESFDYSRGLLACILEFPNFTSPYKSTTVVHLYDGTKWYEFELNEFGVVDFLREAVGSPIHPDNLVDFRGPYKPVDMRGCPVFGKQTLFLEWVRMPHLLCSQCCKCSLFDIDLFVLHKSSGKSVLLEAKTEREFNHPDRSKKEWQWMQWSRLTDKYVSQSMTRFYTVFWNTGRVLSLPLKKGPFTDDDNTDIREDSPQQFDDSTEFAASLRTQIN